MTFCFQCSSLRGWRCWWQCHLPLFSLFYLALWKTFELLLTILVLLFSFWGLFLYFFLVYMSFKECCSPRFCPWPTWYSKIILSPFLSLTIFYLIISKSLCQVYPGFSLRTVLSCRLNIHLPISQTRFIHYLSPLNMLLLFYSLLYLLPQSSLMAWARALGRFFKPLAHHSSQHLNKH